MCKEPLSPIFDETDEFQKSLLEKFNEHCCEFAVTEQNWSALYSLISQISRITCWQTELDDTFLMQVREQYGNITPDCGCECDDEMLYIYPKYINMQLDDCLKLTIIVRNRAEIEEVDVPNPASHWDKYAKRFVIDLRTFEEVYGCACDCKTASYHLKYNAGFDTIPDNLFPLLCKMLEISSLLTAGCTDQAMKCINSTKPDPNSYLVQKRMDKITYSFKLKNTAIEDSIYLLMRNSLMKSLKQISVCDKTKDIYWGGVYDKN